MKLRLVERRQLRLHAIDRRLSITVSMRRNYLKIDDIEDAKSLIFRNTCLPAKIVREEVGLHCY